jgi:hypothetical protein
MYHYLQRSEVGVKQHPGPQRKPLCPGRQGINTTDALNIFIFTVHENPDKNSQCLGAESRLHSSVAEIRNAPIATPIRRLSTDYAANISRMHRHSHHVFHIRYQSIM